MLNKLRDEIHEENVIAGWWSDLQTGESILATRNRPEMLMLVVSELSEADEAFNNESNDDKLPHLPGFDVEVADAAIRLFDLCGAKGVDLERPCEVSIDTSSATEDLMCVVNILSEAMEACRKGRTDKFHHQLRFALHGTITIAKAWGFDLFDVIEQKREFNRNRADHKVENRKAAGGKAF